MPTLRVVNARLSPGFGGAPSAPRNPTSRRFHGDIEASDHILSVERFVQKADSTRRHSARLDDLVGKGRKENDWDFVTLGDQYALQLNPAHDRHLDVRDQARRCSETGRS